MPPLELLSPLHKAVRQIEVSLAPITARFGVSNPEGHLLTYLGSYGPCPISELTRVFGLKPSTLTSMLDRLEHRRYVARALNPKDRRSFVVDVTPRGRRIAGQLLRELEAFEAAVFRRISRTQQDGFRAVIAAVDEVTTVQLRSTGDQDERLASRRTVRS